MKTFTVLLLACWLGGCSTLNAKNRILLCIGFCALQGVEVVKKEGAVMELPTIPPAEGATQ